MPCMQLLVLMQPPSLLINLVLLRYGFPALTHLGSGGTNLYYVDIGC